MCPSFRVSFLYLQKTYVAYKCLRSFAYGDELARLGGISLDVDGIPPRLDENFHMNTGKWASPARCDRVFFNVHIYALEFFPNSISTWLRRVPP